ncbi:MAG: ABC transporter substrate-binding protein [Anaerolineales bacterium]
MSRIRALLAVLVAASMILTACGAGGASAAPIKIGAIFDLTGPTADVSTPYSEGMKDYVTWKNANGGIAGRQIELTSADYAYKVDQAEQLYTQYVQEGVVAFMGWGTGDTEALRTKIAEDKIPFMSASYSAGLLDLSAAPYNFLVGTSYSDQAVIAVRWALDDFKAKGSSDQIKIALIHNDSPFGQSPVADAKTYTEANGGAFMDLAMPKGATDYVAELAQMTTFGAQYVIIQNVSSPAAVLLKDAKSQGFAGQFICLNWCADEILVKLAGDAAEGVMGTLPFVPPTVSVAGQADAEAFLKAKGSSLAEKGLHYTQGWWTMATMAAGIEAAIKAGKEPTGENIRAGLESLQNFSTGDVTAPISFSASSHRGNNALHLYKVSGGAWVQVSDAISAGQ